MEETETGKKVDVKEETDTENADNTTKVTKKNLLQIAEVRMVLYIIPVALIAWLIATIVKNMK